MPNDTNIAGQLGTTLKVTPQRIQVGISTVIGILAGVGAIVAAIHGNDTATAVGGIAASITMIGRYGQVIVRDAIIAARAARPWVDAVAEVPQAPTR